MQDMVEFDTYAQDMEEFDTYATTLTASTAA
jgi:hypothetical protein